MPARSDTSSRHEETHSWTDDLPVCRMSGVGLSTNQIYREHGYHNEEEHEFEDRSFHCRLDDQTFLYGVFDGHEGVQAATFALQRTAAEVLLGQLIGKTSDEDIKEVLRQAFIAVEKGYFETIDDKLAERTNLQCDIDGLSSYEAYKKCPDLVNKLKALNGEVSSGTTAVVALVFLGKLYVANVGDSRALLCRTDSDGVLRVVQLSVDHDLRNEDELLRLAQLGLNVDKIRQGSRLGNQENTRCLGNYLVKGGYKELEELSEATSEPVIAEPEIHGGIILDESCRFLLLLSDGLYKTLEEATGTDQVNKDIAQMTVEQFRTQATLTSVSQAVVDKIVRLHHDMFVGGGNCLRRDDITLLVRNFNFPLPNALSSPTAPAAPSHPNVRFNPIVHEWPSDSYSRTPSSRASSDTLPPTNSSRSDTNSSDLPSPDRTSSIIGRIQPYVDFSDYRNNVERAREEGRLPKDTLY